MPRINLLPWREAERKKRQRDFLIAMAGSFVAGVLVIALTNLAFSQMISHQRDRNNRLEEEIRVLEKAIEEIDGLEAQKERLLARMEIIEQLQRSRPEIVHLFDEVTRQLPEGVYLTGMKQTGSAVQVQGVAQSSTRVSALMRQIDASDWLTDPDVEKVETTDQGPGRKAEFVVNLKQIRQEEDDGMEDAG
jgi:type IV pilus assembly protein PilN